MAGGERRPDPTLRVDRARPVDDMDRVQTLIEEMIPVFANPEINIEIVEGITAEDIVSNEFIDESIGL